METLKRFFRDERGTETVEWAVIIGIIAIGAIVLAAAIGGFVQDAFQSLADALGVGA